MKSIKIMFSGVMLMLLAIALILIDNRQSTWLSGAAAILLPAAAVVFAIGALRKEEKDNGDK